MADAPIYITHKQLNRVFPQINEYDAKVPIYAWELGVEDPIDAGVDIFYANSVGNVDQLYWDGAEVLKVDFNSTVVSTTLGSEFIGEDGTIPTVSNDAFGIGDVIKINDEYMVVVSVADGENTTTVNAFRGVFGTTSQVHASGSNVYKILDASALGLSKDTASPSGRAFCYDSDRDLVFLTVTTNADQTDYHPNDFLIEAGEDFTTMVTQFREDASRYLDSRLDPKLPKSQWRNSKGEFDYIIIRTTGLIASAFMVRTKDPTAPILESIELEYEKNIELLNTGKASIGFQNTGDASMGVIRDVTYTAGSLRPVDLKGRAGGVDYDRIQVKVIAGGNGFGTDTYSVWIKDSDQLKNNQVVTAEKITGDYQPLAHGLQVRFGGNDENDTAAASDEWEVEVRGYNEEIDTADLKGIKMTRRRYY